MMDLILLTTQTIGRKFMYNQDEVNENLTELFQMSPTRTVEETRSNIVKVDKQTIDPATEKQSEKPKRRSYTKKASSRGGARAGSGRPKGSTNKITLDSLVQSIDSTVGMSFEQRLALNYKDAIDRQDWLTVKDYDKAFLSKIVADKQEMDITSNGQTIGANFSFPSQELPDWKDGPTQH